MDILKRLTKRVATYAKANQCTWSFALVVSVIRHQEVTIQTEHREGAYYSLYVIPNAQDDPCVKWAMEKDVYSSTHAAVEDFIFQWFPKNQQASYLEANDRWFVGKLILLGKPPVDLSYLNSGRSFVK